jgi:hypothetical protein
LKIGTITLCATILACGRDAVVAAPTIDNDKTHGTPSTSVPTAGAGGEENTKTVVVDVADGHSRQSPSGDTRAAWRVTGFDN